ncbi:hypothetical protein BDQ12DRAFT_737836 [Crucibulum laeve]|uniref:P-loop containing nucleoside triphosphate hydrolase protein n=1 Tax=Crucibulum laeve TaxID=68775 RepID=A0A5C3LRJ0_9AGAR|nr:hypothetical protein BDQ12DRAFT_737836 [Crucibulum laeve]
MEGAPPPIASASPSNCGPNDSTSMPTTRGYQQEMLEESIHNNIIIALDTGSGKTLIAVLRIKHETERESTKISWFFAPTVALCEQQKNVIQSSLPVSVGLISGALEPNQWKDAKLWERVIRTHRIMVSTPQVFLDALRHGYIIMGRDISLIVFDEAHHAVDKHPYNMIMKEFYFDLPARDPAGPTDTTDVLVRPRILGLTASPIYGGNVIKAFQTIETNLDCTIRAPRRHRSELAQYVHRPIFKHVLYAGRDELNPLFSTNAASLADILSAMDIEKDPYVYSLRNQLSRTTVGTAEYKRIDQKLSKVISKQDSFTHRGIRDFCRCADDICQDLGPWAADWYVWSVMEKAKKAANPYNNIMSTWKNSEKAYLLRILNQVVVSPVSYHQDDIVDDSSDKVKVLIKCLLEEKKAAEEENESYSGLIFVQRRDTVLALRELLSRHPDTKDLFNIGILLGTSESAYRHSFLDITRNLVDETQETTIMDFKLGEKNLIVSTSVAEEGIDIQACGSVIRWDPPQNMASWAQSRGRARRKRSTFTLMFEEGAAQQKDVVKWENLEREMVALYNDPQRDLSMYIEEEAEEEDEEEDDMSLYIESTGALLTLNSAVSHLSHFCAVIPQTAHVDNRPLYDLDPPEFPEGWHTFDRHQRFIDPYTGPFGSKVTLPRTLPLATREFSTERIYKTKISAHRHAAFMAYKALYDAKLLNENLLPIESVVEPHLEDEVKSLLADVEKRAGTANVSIQIDPWVPEDSDSDHWWISELLIQGLPPLRMFTRSQMVPLTPEDGPVLYRPFMEPLKTALRPISRIDGSDKCIQLAREYTRRLFWCLNGSRMVWGDVDFSYLFLPVGEPDATIWDIRRSWYSRIHSDSNLSQEDAFFANAEAFGREYSYPDDLTIIRNGFKFAKAYQFVCWRYEPLSSEEEDTFREYYARFEDLEITYPLLVVRAFPPRTNFLLPIPPKKGVETIPEVKYFHLVPRLSTVTLLSVADTEYAFLLPSILRSLYMTLTVNSFRDKLLKPITGLYSIPLQLLQVAMTASSAGERSSYQRLETLGDTVLKFVVAIQLLAEYPMWHEGYLTQRKDHAVSNVRLAKENIKKSLYRWIIRDRLLGKKWKPSYMKVVEMPLIPTPDISTDEKTTKKKKGKNQDLSTKILADVVESTIGAAYIHGGFDLGYECIKFFGLGLRWQPMLSRVEQILLRVEPDPANIPPQLSYVESMIGYVFNHKLLLIEALTHASYQDDLHTVSYERMEFLGDAVLDMVVTDYLYHAAGKNYSPGHMFLRKAALVNGNFLAYLCLHSQLQIDTALPEPTAEGYIALGGDSQDIYLWQCLLHSSPKVLEDQSNTFARYQKRHAEIEDALKHSTIFPWAALTRLQAPKFFSDIIESLIASVYLDSKGSFDAVHQILRSLGILQVMEHIVKDDVDVLHPVSRLSLWAQKHAKKLEYKFTKEKGNVTCLILVDENEEIRVSDKYFGTASQQEVKFAAAEKAIKAFHLRDVGVNYTILKKKKLRKRKSLKQH